MQCVGIAPEAGGWRLATGGSDPVSRVLLPARGGFPDTPTASHSTVGAGVRGIRM